MFRWLMSRRDPRPSGAAEPIRAGWPAEGDVLGGRYRLDAVLGTGSAGRVYKALDSELDMVVAVKVMRDPARLPDLGPDVQAYAADLRAEAQAAMRLAHRFIVRTFHWTRLDPFEVLIMEHVPGGTLQQRRAVRGHLAPDEAAGFLIDALEGLSWAHEHGVLHNDVKPSNMLVAEGEVVRLCDFGIWSRPAVAVPGQAVGTLPYMSPERLNGDAADARSDVYSSAATLYALVAGSPPFGNGGMRTIEGHLRGPRPRCENAPPALQAVLDVALARDPDDRYASAWALREALRDAGYVSRADRDQEARARQTRPAPTPPEPAPVATAGRRRRVMATAVAGPAPRAPRPDPAAPPAPSTPPAPVGMVRIPERQVRLGDLTVTVRPFFLARHPVTVRDYATWVEATGALWPASWGARRPRADLLDHPVTGVTLADARAYAAAQGARLPTEDEWLAVARPAADKRFPWGDACSPRTCHCPATGATGTAPVGEHPDGESVDGLFDLIGNVWEWTEPGAAPPPRDGGARVFGASFKHRCSLPRGEVPMSEVGPRAEYAWLGFRLARDLTP